MVRVIVRVRVRVKVRVMVWFCVRVSVRFRVMVKTMHQQRMYNKLVFYMEAWWVEGLRLGLG